MILIRRFEDTDTERLAAFMIHWGALPAPPDPTEILHQIRHCRENVSGDLFLAVHKEGGVENIAGYLQMCEISLVCFPPSAELAAVLVHEDLRGRGIGSMLVEKAKDWTREKSLSRLLVSSQTYRAEAHRFYEKHGFVRWKESTFFEAGV